LVRMQGLSLLFGSLIFRDKRLTSGTVVQSTFNKMFSYSEYHTDGPLTDTVVLLVCDEDDPPKYDGGSCICPRLLC
jgi:hypothetical protein